MPCAVPGSPGRRDAIAQGNVDRRALKGSPQHYRWTAFPLRRQSADDIITEPLEPDLRHRLGQLRYVRRDLSCLIFGERLAAERRPGAQPKKVRGRPAT